MGYKGSATIEIEIERMCHKENGALLMMDSVSEDDPDYEYVTIVLTVIGNSYYDEGRTSGLPENCYPAEGDTEIEEIQGPNGSPWSRCPAGDNLWSDIITGEERETILRGIEEEVQEKCSEDYEPDDYDRDYDDFYDNDSDY